MHLCQALKNRCEYCAEGKGGEARLPRHTPVLASRASPLHAGGVFHAQERVKAAEALHWTRQVVNKPTGARDYDMVGFTHPAPNVLGGKRDDFAPRICNIHANA